MTDNFSKANSDKSILYTVLNNAGTACMSVVCLNREFSGNDSCLIVDINPCFSAFTGLSPEQLQGKYITEIKTPLFDLLIQLYHDSRQNAEREFFSFENNQWLKIQLQRLNEKESVFLISDVTLLHNTLTSVENAENRYKNIFSNSPVGIIIEDEEGVILEANESFCNSTGYKREELVNNNIEMLLRESAKNQAKINIRKIIEGSNMDIQVESYKKDGTPSYYQLFETKFILPDGKAGVLSISKDITDIKKREAKVQVMEEFRKLLIEMSSAYISMPLDKIQKEIISSLEKISLFYKADRAYVLNFDHQKKLYHRDYIWYNKNISATLPEKGNISEEDISGFLHGHFNGTILNIQNVTYLPESYKLKEVLKKLKLKSILGIPMLYEEICTGYLVFDFLHDKHNVSEIELQLLKIFAQLIVNLKMRESSEKKLITAIEKAEESNRLKSAFLSNMSHEIRTPMNGILGFLDLIQSSDLSSEERNKYIAIINKSGKRLLDTINDIIEMSKIEANPKHVDITETNLTEMLSYLYDFFKLQTNEKKIGLIIQVPDNSPKIIYTDKYKLEMVLTNLLKNAIKFTVQGQIEFGYVQKGGFLEFFVKDSGIGIPENQLDAIFDRFVQADIRLTRSYEGSGLGLTIAKAHVENLGGEIKVESQHHAGSKFYFTIPLIKPKTTQKNVIPDVMVSTPVDKVQSKTILVAEDDNISFMFLDSILKKHNYKVIRAKNGLEAVEMFKNNADICVVLMDVKMPEMNGTEATMEIRKFNTKIPVIAQTAFAFPEDKDEILSAGCNDYISKPVNKDLLLSKLNKYTGSDVL